MRRTATLFFIVALAIPFVAGAVDKNELEQKGYKGKDNICISERVTLKNGELDVKNDTNNSTLTNCLREYPGNTCPKTTTFPYGIVTFTGIIGSGQCRISKCDPNYESKLSKCLKNASFTGANAIDLGDSTARDSVASLDPYSSRDQQIITQALQDMGASKVTVEDVKANPEAARDYALALLDSDNEKAKEAAMRWIPSLEDAKRLEISTGSESDEDAVTPDTFARDTTFDSGSGDPIMKDEKKAIACLESACGNYNAVGPQVCNSRGCGSAYGKYQVMWFNVPSWTAEACGRVYSSQEFIADTNCQEQVFETKFGQLMSSCGSFAGAASAWHSGSCVPRPGSTDGYMRTAAYVQKAQCYFDGNCQTPAYALTGYQGRGSPFGNVNPFLSASPVGYPAPMAVSSGGGYPYGGAAYPLQQSTLASQSSLQPVSSQLLPQGGQGIVPTSVSILALATSLKPAASIIVQPREVRRGNTLLVSWSTIAMSSSNLCQVYLRVGVTETLLARGNEGSRILTTSATSTSGMWNFTLQCMSISGTLLEREASALVE